MDRIQTGSARARVTTSWAPTGWGQLLRCVGDAVAGAGARAALEGVEETHPVADFVRGGLAEVVVRCGAAWRGGVQDGAAVVLFTSQSVSSHSNPSSFHCLMARISQGRKKLT